MRRITTRALCAGLMAVAFASVARAQTPTPEGTVITNQATASYTDANGNSYTNVTASVAVTVGFQAGVDATSPATASPVVGSTGNTLVVTIKNVGNGTDQFTLSAVSPPANVTVAKYTFNGTDYTTLALLNAALGAANVTAGSTEQVTVTYDVASGATGTGNFDFTAQSVRTTTVTDLTTTVLTFTATPVAAVSATTPSVNRLPSNGGTVQYQETFTVSNTGSASGNFTFTPSVGGANAADISIVSVSPSSATAISAGGNQTVTVTYTVANASTTGDQATITLSASAPTPSGTTSASASTTVTIVRPALTMTKVAYRGGVALTPADRVLPGQTIVYRISISNGGTASASTLSVSDPLPAEVTYVSAADPASGGWTLNNSVSGGITTVTGSLATLAAGTTKYFEITVTIK